MSYNGKSKFVTTKSPDYMNILYTESDSDSIPDLKLPPLKGKKQRKRKGVSARSDVSCCNVWTAVKVTTAIVVFIVWMVLAAVCFWSLRRISQLQDQISALENSDKAATELLKFQSQLAEVNTSVMAVKSGQGGLLEVASALAEVQKKLKALEVVNKELQASVSASKDVLNLPNKLDTLSTTIASLGSDISRLVKDTKKLQDGHLDSRITALEAVLKEKAVAATSTSDKQVTSQEATHINQTLHSGLQSLRQDLDQFSARISVLEKFTKSQPGEDTAWVTALVNRLIQEKMNNMMTESHGTSNTSQVSQVPTDKGELLVFKADILGNLERVNETVAILNQELETITARLESHDNALMNLTAAVVHLSTAGATTSSSSSSSTETGVSGSHPPESTTDSSKPGSVIKIPGIDSLKDLHTAFSKHWSLTDGQLNATLLETDSLIKKDLLQPFDLDHNGLFSEDELAVALGFDHKQRYILKH